MELPPFAIPPLQHILSGDAFFTGGLLIGLALLWRLQRWPGSRTAAFVLSSTGLLLELLTVPAIPWAFFVIQTAALLIWLLQSRKPGPVPSPSSPSPESADSPPATPAPISHAPNASLRRPGPYWSLLLLLITLTGLVWQLWNRQLPYVSTAAASTLTVIADSITAGVGENEAVIWPQLLEKAHPIRIVDLSAMGATAGSALRRVQSEALSPGVILIEIGGNDLLGSTTDEQFERDLDGLLALCCRDDAQVLMFELPLPPFRHRFGQIQRKLARMHGVELIPRRVLAGVLISPRTTLDSIHLNQQGHQQLADSVWKIVGPAFSR
ncbi:SGNH/GDSL hydrolase family protein [Planctomicrobium sp. SH664]|uniref:SGNH/GDSL hydrolase family protein n=1 Tax=Planctomicrobium sp. SH664 TaxID=3448125 RepID=UPI003F5BD94E